MSKDRLAAFSDGVIAIIITIMVLELHVPPGASAAALRPLVPVFLSYVLSFVYIAIYWNNHHHLLYTLTHVDGLVLWANAHLLFWLSLVPFATGWLGENPLAPLPTAVYGLALLMPATAYYLLQKAILRHEGNQSVLARALGRDIKGKLSPFSLSARGGARLPRRVAVPRDLCARRRAVAGARSTYRGGAGRAAAGVIRTLDPNPIEWS